MEGPSSYPHLDTFLVNVMCYQSSWCQAANFAMYHMLHLTFLNLCCYPLLKEGICKRGMRQGKDCRVGLTLAVGTVVDQQGRSSLGCSQPFGNANKHRKHENSLAFSCSAHGPQQEARITLHPKKHASIALLGALTILQPRHCWCDGRWGRTRKQEGED